MKIEERLDLPSLAYRRIRGDMIEVFKYMNDNYNDDCSVTLPWHEHGRMIMMGHGLKLSKRECRSQLRANFFGLRVVNIWNNLPTEIVEAPNVNCFKGRFDRFSGDNKFNMEWDTALENKNGTV